MAADFDEPVFDEEFVRSAAFTEPSASERARPPSRRERRRTRRRLPRALVVDGRRQLVRTV
ncbi:SCO2583/SCO2584 N-terminal domain-containing protein, partial [Actinomadura geliboluensis]